MKPAEEYPNFVIPGGDPTVWRTPAEGCPACRAGRRHAEGDRTEHHRFSGHGYNGREWSHPALDPRSLRAAAEEARP
jgi:hypothetical protein